MAMSLKDNMIKSMPQLEMDKAKRKIVIIYAACVIAVITAYFFFFMKPGLVKLFKMIPKARSLRMEIKVVRGDLEFEQKLKEKMFNLEDKLAAYETKLSREKELPKLLENLSKMASESKLKILSITPVEQRFGRGRSPASEVYQEVPIAVTAQSGYHELGSFINRLENDERYLEVSDIDIKASRNNFRRHDVKFLVHAYTFKGSE